MNATSARQFARRLLNYYDVLRPPYSPAGPIDPRAMAFSELVIARGIQNAEAREALAYRLVAILQAHADTRHD